MAEGMNCNPTFSVRWEDRWWQMQVLYDEGLVLQPGLRVMRLRRKQRDMSSRNEAQGWAEELETLAGRGSPRSLGTRNQQHIVLADKAGYHFPIGDLVIGDAECQISSGGFGLINH
jgi:hypothetical protein